MGRGVSEWLVIWRVEAACRAEKGFEARPVNWILAFAFFQEIVRNSL